MLGIGYAREIDGEILQGGIYTGFKCKPYGISFGYRYVFKGNLKWNWQVGLEADLMAAKDPDEGMNCLPLIKLVPEGAYEPDRNFMSSRLWIAFSRFKRKLHL